MKSVLLYNLYPKSNWKTVTKIILDDVPYHDSIIVNVTLDKIDRFFKKHKYISWYLKRYPKIDKVTFTLNNPKLGEGPGFDEMRKAVEYEKFDILTYTHSKGVTKSKNSNIRDWVKMMKYFLVDRHDLCIKAFEANYALYGTQLNKYNYDRVRQQTYKFCDFWYAGTFVSVDLRKLKREFISTNCIDNYYGIEAFWGNLCDYNLAYCVHKSPFTLYDNPYPEENYKLNNS